MVVMTPSQILIGLMETHHWTEDDVVALLGITHHQLRTFLEGKVRVTLDFADVLAKLGVHTAEQWITIQRRAEHYEV